MDVRGLHCYQAEGLIVHNCHLDLYLADGKTAWSIGVKRLSALLKTSGGGSLTKDSKDEALAILRREMHRRGWLAQSTTHSLPQARAEWFATADGPRGYGGGPIRQVVSDIEVWIDSDGQHASWLDWRLNPHAPAYVFKIMTKGPARSKNILSLGFKKPQTPELADRLHLAMVHDAGSFLTRIGADGHITQKIDGAACHFEVGPHGLRAWSPRVSVRSGQRIEYTAKLGRLSAVELHATPPVRGMAELVFVKPGGWARGAYRALGCLGIANRLGLGAETVVNETAGLLNANALPPSGYEPRLYIYRIDSVGRRKSVLHESLEVNRERCRMLAERDHRLCLPTEVTYRGLRRFLRGDVEGVVGCPRGSNLLAGFKLKLRPDTQDGVVEAITFRSGERGGIAGWVVYRDDKTGRVYNTASGMTHALKMDMMAHPRRYIGRTMVLAGFSGHVARASVFKGFHQDK